MYEQAIKKGDSQAAYNLALSVRDTDRAHSVRCFLESAFLGHSTGMITIAEEHMNREEQDFLPLDIRTAETWLKASFEEGNDLAAEILEDLERAEEEDMI